MLVVPLRRVWATYGITSNPADSLPHACVRLTSEGRDGMLSRVRLWQGRSSLASFASITSGSRRKKRGLAVFVESSEESEESDDAVLKCEIELRERASRQPNPSPADPATQIVLRLSAGPLNRATFGQVCKRSQHKTWNLVITAD